jgi:hypothetical protein
MKLNFKRLTPVVLALTITGCASVTPVSQDIYKPENNFNIKKLEQSYLKRKLEKWLDEDNGPMLLKELQFARAKGETEIPWILTVPIIS